MEETVLGGGTIGKTGIFTLQYADDIALVADTVDGMNLMIKKLEKYVDSHGLMVNIGKTRIQVFKRGNKKGKKEVWKWKDERIEMDQSFNFLGCVMNFNGGWKKHLQYVKKKADIKMREVWSVGERYFPCNFKLRKYLFDTLVKPILMYGAEAYGWEDCEELDQCQGKYFKWILGIEKSTPDYIWRTECGEEKLSNEMLIRAWKYQSLHYEEERSKWVQEIVKEEDARDRGIGMRKLKTDKLAKIGLDYEDLKRKEAEGWNVEGEIKQRLEDIQKQEREGRIKRSIRFSKYEAIKPKEKMARYIAENIWKIGDRKNQKILINYRIGSDLKGRKVWLKEEEMNCRLCGKEKEEIDHLVDRCVNTESIREKTYSRRKDYWKEAVDESGKEIVFLSKLDKLRKGHEKDKDQKGEEE